MSTAMRPLSATSTFRSTSRSNSVASSWLMRLSSAISTRASRWRSLSVCSTPRLATTASCGLGTACSLAPADCSLAVNQNTLPRPSSLSTPTAPPINCTSSRAIDRPRPVPPKRRVVDPSACSNGLNRRSRASGEMPAPVSRTAKRIVQSAPARASTSQRSTTLPRSVNFTALLSRFTSTCASRSASPRSACGRSPRSTVSARPLRRAPSVTIAVARASSASTEKSTGASTSLPASILDRSRMSLMMSSRCIAASPTLARRSDVTGSCWSRSIRCVRPMITFIGVRISWLMLARKADLACAASSATSRAATSSRLSACRSACARFDAVMSEASLKKPRTSPRWTSGMYCTSQMPRRPSPPASSLSNFCGTPASASLENASRSGDCSSPKISAFVLPSTWSSVLPNHSQYTRLAKRQRSSLSQ